MTWRLLRAFGWRLGWAALVMIPVAGMLWLSALAERPAAFPPVILALSAILVAISVFWSREMRVLPFSRLELWRMTWCTAVVVPVACLFVVRSVVTNLEASLLHAAFEFVYLGIAIASLPLLMVSGASASRSDRVINHGLFVVILGWLLVPFLVDPLPARFATLPPWALAMLSLGVVVAVIPFLRMPLSVGRRSPGVTNAPVLRVRQPGFLDGLSGLSRLLPGQLGNAVATCVFVFGIELSPLLFFGPSPSGANPFDATGLLPFVPGQSNVDVLQKSGIGMFLAVSLSSSGWTDWLRQLKFLPLTRTQLVLLLSSGPALTAAVFWILLATVHVLAVEETPVTLRYGVFVFIIGVGTLLNALWVQRKSLAFVLLAPVMIITPRISGVANSSAALAGVGLTLIGIALAINHRTVTMATSSSPAYRPPRIFGSGPAEAPR